MIGDVHLTVGQHPRQPAVEGAEEQAAIAVGVELIEQPGQLRGRLIRSQSKTVLALGDDALEDGAQILPTERRPDGCAGGARPSLGSRP